jgi:hypothetical protein
VWNPTSAFTFASSAPAVVFLLSECEHTLTGLVHLPSCLISQQNARYRAGVLSVLPAAIFPAARTKLGTQEDSVSTC